MWSLQSSTSNIHGNTAHIVYISIPIRYSSACVQFSYWRKATKQRLRCNKNSTVVIMNWLTIIKYQFLKWQQIISILHILFHSSITDKTRLLSDMTMRTHDRCRIENRNCLPIARTLVNNRVLVGSVLLIFIVFSVIFYFCFVCLRFVSCGTSSTYGEYIS